jgi:phosphonatase-like hydrolase
MSIELVVFDMAGTTVNDEDSVSRCVQAALEAVGVTVTIADVNRVMGIPKPEAIRILIGNSPRHAELAGRVGEIHRDFVTRSIRFYQADPSVREVPGSQQTFRALKAAGINVALDTGFNRAITQTILDHLGWSNSPLIDATICGDEVLRTPT